MTSIDSRVDQLTALRAPGTYLLLLHLPEPRRLEIGRLGLVLLPTGWYIYVGSALGGLGARLRRHLSLEKRPHWHIDSLRAATTLIAVGAHIGSEHLECPVAASVMARPGATLPVPRFGSSDCRCPAHLVHFTTLPDLRLDASWHVWSLEDHPQGVGFGSDGVTSVPSAGTGS